ncbi:MAG: DsbA family protein [Deltaproteobacteria bacterium]|nr:DsbA family protein [Deltaproteobacteria bacterium]
MPGREASPRLRFSYWSDPLCIWALVAQQKLDRVLGEIADRVHVDYRIVPVFGSVPWRFSQGPWAKEGVEGRIAATRRIAEQAGRSDVSGECWRRAAPATSWGPAAAIKAVFSLEDGVGEAAGPTYQRLLRERFFVHEQNTALRRVQLELAEEMKLPIASIEARLDDGSALALVCEDHAEKERLRIQGSPTYVFDGGRAMLYGNFDYGILHGTVDELLRGLVPGGSAC